MKNVQRLTKQQEARLQAKLAALAAAHLLRLSDTKTEWEDADYVIGFRDDVLQRGIERPCSHCRTPVFTSRAYPEDVVLLCEVCAASVLLKEDAA